MVVPYVVPFGDFVYHALGFAAWLIQELENVVVEAKWRICGTYVPLTPPPLPERGWPQAGGEGELPFNSLLTPLSNFQMEMLSILRRMVPRGILMSTSSPTFLLSSPCAMGVLMDIFPSARLASFSLTMV